ncbi:hypothetical protein RIF29_00484 [Crotalaria pallida]|uniref:Uncharacterized protein n=1 Tax=Crotalaria pallida TaxID=3830 RepID=A0AAN9IVN2_CROPI
MSYKLPTSMSGSCLDEENPLLKKRKQVDIANRPESLERDSKLIKSTIKRDVPHHQKASIVAFPAPSPSTTTTAVSPPARG